MSMCGGTHRRGDNKYATVIVDLTSIRAGTCPARLLDVVEGRSKLALAERGRPGETRWKWSRWTASPGLDRHHRGTLRRRPSRSIPCRAARRPGSDRCRRRVQSDPHEHRGHRRDPIFTSRRTLHAGADRLTDKQNDRIEALFADDACSNSSPRSARRAESVDRNHHLGGTLTTKLLDISTT